MKRSRLFLLSSFDAAEFLRWKEACKETSKQRVRDDRSIYHELSECKNVPLSLHVFKGKIAQIPTIRISPPELDTIQDPLI